MWNIQDKRIASEVRDGLGAAVTRAKETASPTEHDMIDLAGQALHFAMQGVHDDHLVEVQTYGNATNFDGSRAFFVSVQVTPISAKAANSAKKIIKPWTPDQGPLGPVRVTEGDADASSNASSSAVPGDTTR